MFFHLELRLRYAMMAPRTVPCLAERPEVEFDTCLPYGIIRNNNPRQACYPEMGSARKREAQIGGVFFYGDQTALHKTPAQIIPAR